MKRKDKDPKNKKAVKTQLERYLSPEEFLTVFKKLNELFPKCFSITNVRPLKKQIKQELFDLSETHGLNHFQISKFLLQYTYTPEYMIYHKAGEKRIDLYGNETDSISDEEAISKLKLYKKFIKNKINKSHKKH